LLACDSTLVGHIWDGPHEVLAQHRAHHHAAVHNNKWTIHKHQGVTFFQPAPWLDPTQPLLRNIYWSV